MAKDKLLRYRSICFFQLILTYIQYKGVLAGVCSKPTIVNCITKRQVPRDWWLKEIWKVPTKLSGFSIASLDNPLMFLFVSSMRISQEIRLFAKSIWPEMLMISGGRLSIGVLIRNIQKSLKEITLPSFCDINSTFKTIFNHLLWNDFNQPLVDNSA